MNYVRQMNGNILSIIDNMGSTLIQIKEETIEQGMAIFVSGELCNEVAYEFEDELYAVLSVCENVWIDFSELKFISSMALNALLQTQKMADQIGNKKMVLYGVQGQVKEILRETGFSDLFQIEDGRCEVSV